MKILLACEGQSEVYLLKDLIRRGYLTFEHPLILDEPIKLRQLIEIGPIINSLPIEEEIIIYRIGDTLKEEFSLTKFKLRSERIKIYKVCTKTELEILIIINEGLYSEFVKCTKNTKPKSFIKKKIPNLDIESYFANHDMYDSLKEYKRIKKHNKNELYLFDLLTKR